MEAEPLYSRAIAIGEAVLGSDHPNLATWLNNKAGLLSKQAPATRLSREHGSREIVYHDHFRSGFSPDHSQGLA